MHFGIHFRTYIFILIAFTCGNTILDDFAGNERKLLIASARVANEIANVRAYTRYLIESQFEKAMFDDFGFGLLDGHGLL